MKIWEWFTGKKTYLAMTGVIIAYVGRTVYPEGEIVWKWLETFGVAGGAGGLLHKAIR